MNKTSMVFNLTSILFALIMLASGLAKLSEQEALVQATAALGYPLYLLKILSVAYVIGVIAIVQRKSEVIKQWGYAGFAIALIGASGSHVLAGQPFSTAVPALVLLSLLALLATLNQKLLKA